MIIWLARRLLAPCRFGLRPHQRLGIMGPVRGSMTADVSFYDLHWRYRCIWCRKELT